MIEIDLDIVRRLALITIALGVSVWLAVRHTHDLDDVKNRGQYRMAWALFLCRGILFTFELLGWLDRIG